MANYTKRTSRLRGITSLQGKLQIQSDKMERCQRHREMEEPADARVDRPFVQHCQEEPSTAGILGSPVSAAATEMSISHNNLLRG